MQPLQICIGPTIRIGPHFCVDQVRFSVRISKSRNLSKIVSVLLSALVRIFAWIKSAFWCGSVNHASSPKLYRSYYPHRLRELVSGGIFNLKSGFKKIVFTQELILVLNRVSQKYCLHQFFLYTEMYTREYN